MATILLVEDNDQVAELFAEILGNNGHVVDRVAAAYEAILKASQTKYDLVLMDLLLEGMNGAVTALALRGLGYAGPILVITGGLLPIDEHVIELAGFSGRLLKPVKLEELQDEVARQLKGQG